MSRTSQPKQSPLNIQELLSAILLVTDRPTLLSCSLVSKAWYIPAMNALWRHVYWKPLLEEGEAYFLEGLAKYGRHTIELQDNTMADMSLIAEHCPHLKCLRLSITTPDDSSLANLLARAPRISSLHLFCCRQLSSESIWSMARLTHLRVLDLRNLLHVDEDGLMAVLTNCPKLRQLCLEDVNLVGMTLQGLRQSGIRLELETLSLMRSNPRGEMIANFLRCSPELSSLSLARNYGVGLPEMVLHEVHESLIHMTFLNLESCKLIDNTSIMMLFVSCPLLTRVNVMGTAIEDSGLEQLANSCLALERLNIGYCHEITDAGARYVLDHCRRLKFLDLSGHLGLTARIFFGARWQCTGLESLVLADIDMSWPEHHDFQEEEEEKEEEEEEGYETAVAVKRKEEEEEEDEEIDGGAHQERDANHAAMFGQLSQLRHLKDLAIGGAKMSIRLSDGLDKLGELPCLESWQVRQLEGTLGEDEIRWLIEAWPLTLKRVRYDRDTWPKTWMRYYRRRRPRLLFS
ncbi:hypothetical protein DFQ26_003494 [Actinomortierella ambigua]|nr:hypothetical protein DFQ26_003494 [Actinomortierella ambigua]